jgi:hypothetical protein
VRGGIRGLTALAACVVTMLAAAAQGGGAVRDDTQWLQARLDAGGNVFLPKLPNNRCYATRGLWLSRDGTSITSDGACIVALGPGEARIKTAEGRPVRANAVFFLTHSNIRLPPPVRVTIRGLRITVPASKRMHGIAVFGHETTLSDLTIDGSPLTNVLIGAGRKGSGGMAARITVSNSLLKGGTRAVISAYGAIGLSVGGNTLSGARGTGLHIQARDRGQPTLDVRVARNRIRDNGGPGIFLDLEPANGPPVLASGIEINHNEVLRNARRARPTRRAGIVLAGGQNDGEGTVAVRDNVIRGNRGPGILRRKLRLRLSLEQNDLGSNAGGAIRGDIAAARSRGTASAPSRPPVTTGANRDDTAWLQARLDRPGGTIFLPKLPNGECYATRGLWVSRDDTTITSDGACVVSLGLGPVRLRSNDGDPIAASGVFYVSRSSRTQPAPIGVTISNLKIIVPEGQSMYGVVVNAHQATLDGLTIAGAPKDNVQIGDRANGNGLAANVSVLNCMLSGASRNAISAGAVIGLRIKGNTIEGVRDAPPGQPAAGIDVEADDRAQPTLRVRIVGNTIRDNAGPGILLELEPNSGASVIATDLEVSGNNILRNSRKRTPPKRAGVVIAGGQDGGEGTLLLENNVIRDNGGPGILGSRLIMRVRAIGNDLAGNEAGPSRGI